MSIDFNSLKIGQQFEFAGENWIKITSEFYQNLVDFNTELWLNDGEVTIL